MIKTTKTIIISAAAILIVYDIYAVISGDVETISTVLYAWAKAYPIMPFALGVVCGHLFWPQNKP